MKIMHELATVQFRTESEKAFGVQYITDNPLKSIYFLLWKKTRTFTHSEERDIKAH